jgi:hypothetical protein
LFGSHFTTTLFFFAKTMALEWVDYEMNEKLKGRRKKKDDFIETDSEAESRRKKNKHGRTS